MRTVGSFEAKTHLSRLLKDVEKGEEIIITNRGRPVARIVPVENPASPDEVFDRLKAIRKEVSHGGPLDMAALRDEGRKR